MPAPSIVLLSHAESDLISLARCKALLPDGFSQVSGLSLQNVCDQTALSGALDSHSSPAQPGHVFLFRILGGPGSVPGLSEIVSELKVKGNQIILLAGTGEIAPDLAALSTVGELELADIQEYFQLGGEKNIAQMLRLISDRLFMTAFGYDPPEALPEHGIYHPDLSSTCSISDWMDYARAYAAAVGIIFYRAHWLSGNTGFIDALVQACQRKDICALPIFTSSLRAMEAELSSSIPGRHQSKCSTQPLPEALKLLIHEEKPLVDVVLNTTAFSMTDINSGGITESGWASNSLVRLDVPIIQAIASNMTEAAWRHASRGLSPMDTAMNVVIPEFDGRIIGVPISFKTRYRVGDVEVAEYLPQQNRIERTVDFSSRLIELRKKKNADKRIAFILTNSSAKAQQVGNAVGLDAPASLHKLMLRMKENGYTVPELPDNGSQLIHQLLMRGSYDTELLSESQCKDAIALIDEQTYLRWFDELPMVLREKMAAQWGVPPGSAYLHEKNLAVIGLRFGNCLVLLQPPRGYGMDPNAIYHQPDLPPTHHYYGVYRWLKDGFGADAIVHVGKHGTLEWLPGKGVGLSEECFPDALLADLPLIYPFIINDPGEGAQAKRRGRAVIVDHLMPPMTTADTYGVLADLTRLVDEYYQVEAMDPARLPVLRQQIWEKILEANLHYDLEELLEHELSEHHGNEHNEHDSENHVHEHEDHYHDNEHADHYHEPEDHDHDHDHADHNRNQELAQPAELAKMSGTQVSHLIQEIDGYLCELGAAQIRDGLHILAEVPSNESLIDMICSLVRLPNQDVPGLQEQVCLFFKLSLNQLIGDEHKTGQLGARLIMTVPALERAAGRSLITNADALEEIDKICKKLVSELCAHEFQESSIDAVIEEVLSHDRDINERSVESITQVLRFVCRRLVPDLNKTTEEIDNLLNALCGSFIPPGPSGAPTRGMAHILPTGRNFYSIDPHGLPSKTAWTIGQRLADQVLSRYRRETGGYPESVAISVWGTSAMRTHGDDVAEILALIGVKPMWQSENGRVSGFVPIPLSELGRPRIDVMTRISGLFRDAFPRLIELLDSAIEAVIALDEPLEMNFLRKHYLADVEKLVKDGCPVEEAKQRAGYRIFGCKPGSYGAGILPLLQEKNWTEDADFAEVFVNWGGYAYGRLQQGQDARAEFRSRLAVTEVAIHNQDNREHDIFDSDDYLQFHGGMIAAVRSIRGTNPRSYFGDSSNPANAMVRSLREETLRVFRSRVVNPKWLTGIQKHGYKGGLELTATVDYLFGYDATAGIMDDWMYEKVAETYALGAEVSNFLKEHNPWALKAICERLLESAQRGMWADPDHELIAKLEAQLLRNDLVLESQSASPHANREITK